MPGLVGYPERPHLPHEVAARTGALALDLSRHTEPAGSGIVLDEPFLPERIAEPAGLVMRGAREPVPMAIEPRGQKYPGESFSSSIGIDSSRHKLPEALEEGPYRAKARGRLHSGVKFLGRTVLVAAANNELPKRE